MANPKRAYAENAAGDFFVDDTCIDCDLCRQIAPAVFKEQDDHSVVYRQPRQSGESHRAAMALVACPTGSIGTRTKLDIKPASASFPELIEATGGGVLYEPGEVKALADAVEDLLANPARLTALSAAGRQAVWRDFTAERMAENVAAEFQRLATSKPLANRDPQPAT